MLPGTGGSFIFVAVQIATGWFILAKFCLTLLAFVARLPDAQTNIFDCSAATPLAQLETPAVLRCGSALPDGRMHGGGKLNWGGPNLIRDLPTGG